jgi:hypothetical protein
MSQRASVSSSKQTAAASASKDPGRVSEQACGCFPVDVVEFEDLWSRLVKPEQQRLLLKGGFDETQVTEALATRSEYHLESHGFWHAILIC